jgi:hypothetical protein
MSLYEAGSAVRIALLARRRARLVADIVLTSSCCANERPRYQDPCMREQIGGPKIYRQLLVSRQQDYTFEDEYLRTCTNFLEYQALNIAIKN